MILKAALVAVAALQPPVATLKELGPALRRCYHAPAGSEGMVLTLRFSLTKAGALQARPQVTYSHLLGSAGDQKRFVEAVMSSLDACTPVPLTSGLGEAVAGRPLVFRFIGGKGASSI